MIQKLQSMGKHFEFILEKTEKRGFFLMSCRLIQGSEERTNCDDHLHKSKWPSVEEDTSLISLLTTIDTMALHGKQPPEEEMSIPFKAL